MGTRLAPVPFDIETTGFETDATVTVAGMAVPLGCRLFLNAGGGPGLPDGLEADLAETFGTTVRLSGHRGERALLEAVGSFVDDAVAGRKFMLVAYNGERFRGGFDLPFLRTRCARLDVAWPFDGLPYADLLPIVENRFNTTGDGGEANDLVGAYERLVGGALTPLDPFDESSEAVAAYERREFRPLLAHNLADVLRTDALATLAQEYCGRSEFDLKSLTPTVRDPALSPPGGEEPRG